MGKIIGLFTRVQYWTLWLFDWKMILCPARISWNQWVVHRVTSGKRWHSYGKSPFLVSFPMKNGGSFHSYVAVCQNLVLRRNLGRQRLKKSKYLFCHFFVVFLSFFLSFQFCLSFFWSCFCHFSVIFLSFWCIFLKIVKKIEKFFEKWQKNDRKNDKKMTMLREFFATCKCAIFFVVFLSFFCHFVENLSFFCRFGASFSKLVKKIEFFFEKWQKNDRQNWNDKKTTKTWQKKWQTKLKWQKKRQKNDKQNDRQNWNDKKNDKKMTKKWQTKLKWQKKRQKNDKQNDRQNWNDKKNDKKWQKKWQTKLKWQKKWQKKRQKNDKINIWTISRVWLRVSSNLVPLVNIKIAGKWMFIPLKMVLIGIDPYPCKRLPEGNTTRCGVHQPFLDHFPVSPTGFSTSLGRNRCWLVNRTTTRWILWFMDVYGTYIELLII